MGSVRLRRGGKGSIAAGTAGGSDGPNEYDYIQYFFERHYEKAENLLDVCNTIKNWAVTVWIATIGFRYSTPGAGIPGIDFFPFAPIVVFYLMETMWRTVFRYHADRAEHYETLLYLSYSKQPLPKGSLPVGFYSGQLGIPVREKLTNFKRAALHETNLVLYAFMSLMTGALLVISLVVTSSGGKSPTVSPSPSVRPTPVSSKSSASVQPWEPLYQATRCISPKRSCRSTTDRYYQASPAISSVSELDTDSVRI